jgi:hypothetical protein
MHAFVKFTTNTRWTTLRTAWHSRKSTISKKSLPRAGLRLGLLVFEAVILTFEADSLLGSQGQRLGFKVNIMDQTLQQPKLILSPLNCKRLSEIMDSPDCNWVVYTRQWRHPTGECTLTRPTGECILPNGESPLGSVHSHVGSPHWGVVRKVARHLSRSPPHAGGVSQTPPVFLLPPVSR